jgi:hypothetical protein
MFRRINHELVFLVRGDLLMMVARTEMRREMEKQLTLQQVFRNLNAATVPAFVRVPKNGQEEAAKK